MDSQNSRLRKGVVSDMEIEQRISQILRRMGGLGRSRKHFIEEMEFAWT